VVSQYKLGFCWGLRKRKSAPSSVLIWLYWVWWVLFRLWRLLCEHKFTYLVTYCDEWTVELGPEKESALVAATTAYASKLKWVLLCARNEISICTDAEVIEKRRHAVWDNYAMNCFFIQKTSRSCRRGLWRRVGLGAAHYSRLSRRTATYPVAQHSTANIVSQFTLLLPVSRLELEAPASSERSGNATKFRSERRGTVVDWCLRTNARTRIRTPV